MPSRWQRSLLAQLETDWQEAQRLCRRPGAEGEEDLGHGGFRLGLGTDQRLSCVVMLEDKSSPKGAADVVILGLKKNKFTGHMEISRLLPPPTPHKPPKYLLCVSTCHPGKGFQGLDPLRPCITRSWNTVPAHAQVCALSNCKML